MSRGEKWKWPRQRPQTSRSGGGRIYVVAPHARISPRAGSVREREGERGKGVGSCKDQSLGLGDLDTAGGAEGRLDTAIETELTGSDGTDHDETGTHATEEALDAELLRELEE
jgi:hypothetical protein